MYPWYLSISLHFSTVSAVSAPRSRYRRLRANTGPKPAQHRPKPGKTRQTPSKNQATPAKNQNQLRKPGKTRQTPNNHPKTGQNQANTDQQPPKPGQNRQNHPKLAKKSKSSTPGGYISFGGGYSFSSSSCLRPPSVDTPEFRLQQNTRF